MLAAAERWGGGEDERPFLPRAFSRPARGATAASSSCSRTSGPGTERLCELGAGRRAGVTGPLGLGFRAPARRPPRAARAAAGSGTAPLAIWQDELLAARRAGAAPLLGFRDADHAAGRHAAAQRARRHRRRLARPPRPRHRPARRRARRRRRTPTVYACGPPPMLEAVRALCAERGVAGAARARVRAWRAASAPASAASCRCATAATCASASTGRCSTAPRSRRCRRIERRSTSAACDLAHPIVNGSGTFDAIAARRAFGDALLERFPFSAFVSKTITLAAARRQPAAAAVRDAGRA